MTTRAQGEERAPRVGDRWVTLPNHLALSAGEQAVVSQGHVWVHRVDWDATWVDERGTKHPPVRGVCLGPEGVLEPPWKIGRGLGSPVGDKTPEFISGENGSRPGHHPQEYQLGIGKRGGRPRKDAQDGAITRLAEQGLGVKAIARELRLRGFEISYRTVSRRVLSGSPGVTGTPILR